MKKKHSLLIFFSAFAVLVFGSIIGIIVGAGATAEAYHQCFYE